MLLTRNILNELLSNARVVIESDDGSLNIAKSPVEGDSSFFLLLVACPKVRLISTFSSFQGIMININGLSFSNTLHSIQ
jgi:hypothetical protein